MISSKVHFYVSDYTTKKAEVQFVFKIHWPSFFKVLLTTLHNQPAGVNSPVSSPLAATPAAVASSAPVRVYLVFVTLAAM